MKAVGSVFGVATESSTGDKGLVRNSNEPCNPLPRPETDPVFADQMMRLPMDFTLRL